jgi:acyl-CoA synthetase (AMP-forming)/AMP-acid ligase II
VPPLTTLYERWLRVARAYRHEFALRDLSAHGEWTFAELAAAAEAEANPAGPAAFPQGGGAEFILTVLRAWRSGQIVCPLETGQPRPVGPWPAAPVVHLKTTSATTGRPRLVAFTAEELAADADHLVPTMGLRRDWPNLGVISLAHSYGFSNLVTPLLLHGIPLILGPSALPESVRLAARDQPALTLPAVPALWRAWHEARAIPSGVRLAISAGAPLPLALERAVFEDVGLKIHNFYGSTECGGIAYDRSAVPRTDASLAGTPVENVTLAVAADGCLEVRGPNVAQGTWPEPSPAVGQGIFRTNDLACLRNGQVFLLGRASEIINVAGRKVAPETIEQALLQHPQVREALVLGLPIEGGRGEAIAAVVVCTSPVQASELREFLRARLPAWQVPRHWHFERASLANARGKVARAEWRRVFASSARVGAACE